MPRKVASVLSPREEAHKHGQADDVRLRLACCLRQWTITWNGSMNRGAGLRAAMSVSQLDGLIANRQCANFPVEIRQQQSTSAGSNLHHVIVLEIRH